MLLDFCVQYSKVLHARNFDLECSNYISGIKNLSVNDRNMVCLIILKDLGQLLIFAVIKKQISHES